MTTLTERLEAHAAWLAGDPEGRRLVEHDRVLLAYAEKHVELLAQLEGRTAPSATFKVGDEG
jgi:hypothetical protein